MATAAAPVPDRRQTAFKALLGALILAAAPPAVAQPLPASAPSAADIAAARAFFDAIRDGSDESIEAFAERWISPRAAEFEPPEQLVRRMRTLAEQSGGIDIVEWTESGDQVRFAGTARVPGIPVRGVVGMADGKLLGFQIGPDREVRGADAPDWPQTAASAEAALAAIERELDWLARTERFSGAVVIARRGQPVLERAYGLASRSPDRPNRTDTPFHTASTTKMLTAAAVATLVEQGRLAFDTPIAQAVPALADAPGAAETTIADLLGHRVSYGDYLGDERYRAMERAGTTATQLLTLVADRQPRPAREGRISYSNANYLVLGAAIEAASGQSYYDYVADHVLRPIGMTSTQFGMPDARQQGAAIGWIKDDLSDPLGLGEWQANDGVVPMRGGPPGGIWSSARDMSRFIEAMATGRLIRPATLDAMLADRRMMGRTFHYGLGLMANEVGGRPYFGHDGGGGNAGVSTSAFAARDGSWSVTVLSNFSSPAGDDLGKQFIDLLLTVPERSGAGD